MSENDETMTPEQKEEPCNPETNTDKDITFTSIAETLNNKENKEQSIEMMSKLQELMYEHLVADQEDLIRKEI